MAYWVTMACVYLVAVRQEEGTKQALTCFRAGQDTTPIKHVILP